jgi:hypothetical protein
VERLLRRWPGVRCCYEAGPTGFGLYRQLSERGIDCAVVAPGLVPQRPGDRVKTDPRDARKLARLLAGGLLEPIHVPSPEREAARDLVRAREDARPDRMRDRHRLSRFCLRHRRRLPGSSWSVVRRKWLGEQCFGFAPEQLTFDTYIHAVDLVDARIEALEKSDPGDGRAGALVRARRQAALSARHRHADRPRPGRGDRRLRPLPDSGGVDGLRRARALGALLRRAPPAGVDHQGRQQPRAPAVGRGGLARAPPPEGRLRPRPPPTRPARRRHRTRLAGSGWPAAASRTRRSSSPAPASSPASSGRSRRTSRSGARERPYPASRPSAADASDHTENPRELLCGTARR